MKLNNEARELLDRYLLGVKRQLSGKEREDITAEIESHIFDSLEEKNPNMEEITVKELQAVLEEMGSPYKVSCTFRPQQSLIGPRLFPIYVLVLKILVGVVVGALLLSTVISTIVGGDAGSFWKMLFELLGSIWSGALTTGGVVTLIFAIIERVSEEKSLEEIEGFEELKEMEEFKASNLPELPEKEKKFDRAGIIIEMFFSVVGLAFFTYIQTTGGYFPWRINPGEGAEMIRIFTDSYLPFIPVVLGITGLELGRNITLLVQGHHSRVTTWWNILAQCANVVMMGLLLKAMPIITFADFTAHEALSNLAKLEPLANTGIKIAMWLGIVGTVIDIIRKVVQEVKNPTY